MIQISCTEFNQVTDKVFSELGIACDWNDETRGKFRKLAELLLSENEKYNLTAIRTLDGVIKNHFFDSTTVAPYLPQGARIIDVGSGAGFPALPLAIVRPDLRIVALDSTQKKTDFTKMAASLLELTNIDAISARAEELVRDVPMLRESFDCTVARSVAALPILSELCVPFVKVGGVLAAMKSESASHELNESRKALEMLGCGDAKIIPLYQSREDEVRTLFLIEKTGATPEKYPRAYAQIKKKPL